MRFVERADDPGATLPAPKAKLRSTTEAAEHIISLRLQQPCTCRYCAKTDRPSSRGINSSSPRASPARSTPSLKRGSPAVKKPAPLGAKRPRATKSTTGEPSDSDGAAPPPAKRVARPSAGKSTKPATSSSLKPVGRDPTEFQGPFADPMRRRELGAQTFARAKELVWCSVEPLTDPDPTVPALDWWPAIVLEHETVKTNRRVEDGVRRADGLGEDLLVRDGAVVAEHVGVRGDEALVEHLRASAPMRPRRDARTRIRDGSPTRGRCPRR